MAAASSCALCVPDRGDLSSLAPRENVYSDGSWRVVVNNSALKGWLLVSTLRHVSSLADLDDAEAAAIGPLLALGTRALVEVVGCERTYAMMFAEGTPHVHFSLVPRMADIPDRLKGAAVSGYNAEGPRLTDDQRDELAGALRPRFAAARRPGA